MKKRRHLFILFFGLLSLISVSGCFQYPEGPVFTLQLKDERLNGTWLLTNVNDPSGADVTNIAVDTIIGNDTVSVYPYQNSTLTVIVDRSGNKTWSQFKDGELMTHATFQFADHSNYIIVEYELTDFNNQTAIQIFYDILKLTDKEFKYVDDKGYTLDYKKY